MTAPWCWPQKTIASTSIAISKSRPLACKWKSQVVERKKNIVFKASGTHIHGLDLTHCPSTSSSNHPPDALSRTSLSSAWFGVKKKSFVIWQKFCDYGEDHSKTFSKLVHINDFHSLRVSKMRQRWKSGIKL